MRDQFDLLSNDDLCCPICGDRGRVEESGKPDVLHFCSCSVGRRLLREAHDRDRRDFCAKNYDVNWDVAKRKELLGTCTSMAEVDVSGMDFDAVKRTIEALPPGGATLVRRESGRTFIVGGDVEFAVWAAVKQGYVKRRL